MPMARHQLVACDVVGDQCGAHAEVGRPDQTVQAGNDEHEHGVQGTGERQRHEQDGQRRIGGPHDAEQVAVADPVAGHAEQRRHQRARELQGAEQGEQQHRAGLDQHVPAQDQRLHLECAGGNRSAGHCKRKLRLRKRVSAESPTTWLKLGARNQARLAALPFPPCSIAAQFSCVPRPRFAGALLRGQ